ncbi:MAG: DUF169 domain-containing protein [bacterium]|jgi:hypothetical protein|nr:DUF169 domain-containing protein [bacterium]
MMESKIAGAVGLAFHPVAVVFAEQKPEKALQFKEEKWGCVMTLFANAAKGKTGAFDAKTFGCWGGGVGLGFGNVYQQFPGGTECFARFLSTGNKEWEKGRAIAQAMEGKAGSHFIEEFLEGERYVQSPELVKQWLEEIPITHIDSPYVLFKPLIEVEPEVETPQTVVFLANADQLSALVILANYGREGMDNVMIPWAAGCQTIGILPFREGRSDKPRAVVGMTDISARQYVRTHLGADLLTFAAPWALFLEMEANVEGSFLERPTWQALRGNE